MTSSCCPPEPSVPTSATPVDWCSGNFTYRYQSGRITKTPIANPIPDGVYPNATLTIVNGCITAVAQGTNIVYSACDPCATPTPPPTPGDVDLDGDICNLTTQSGNGLLTLLYTANSPCIAISGCGTPGSPLTATPVISPNAGNAIQCLANGLFVANPTATVGVNYTGCNIQITNGLITALPLPYQPVLELTSSDGSVVITRNPGNVCQVDLQAIPQPLSPAIAGGILGAGVYNAVGDLSDPPDAQYFAAVGAANPRDMYVYITGVGWRQMVGVTITL